MANSVKDIMNFFSGEGKPVKTKEFTEFWQSCSAEDKEHLKNAELKEIEKF